MQQIKCRPAAQGDERVYEKNFWKSPVYHYSLKKDGNANCGKDFEIF